VLFDRTTQASLPDDTRVYAVGDPHGCAVQLDALHALIAADCLRARESRKVIIYLGDYLDRGPDSSGVIERLLGPVPGGLERLFLKGNHEAMALAALSPFTTTEVVEFWLDNGGAATLASYGTDAEAPQGSWMAAVPPAHLAFLRGLRSAWSCGGYLFVHAGIRPGVLPEAQDEEDLIWIREPFLSWRSEADPPGVVVHGHTPARAPEVLRHRIGVDTGAVFGGKLTAAVLWANKVRFLQA
jgi:serine/threonine protein phosphatase 1